MCKRQRPTRFQALDTAVITNTSSRRKDTVTRGPPFLLHPGHVPDELMEYAAMRNQSSLSTEMPQRKRRALKTRSALLGAVALATLASTAGGAVRPAFAQAPQTIVAPQPTLPSFADVVDQVKPAVVSVRAKASEAKEAQVSGDQGGGRNFNLPDFGLPDDHPFQEFFKRFRGEGRNEGPRFGSPNPRRGISQGSGFFISADGYLVTNNHVIDKSSSVEVLMDDGRILEATVVGTDPKTDLALLKVDQGGNFPHVRLATEKSRIGDWVVAIGNPFGLGGTVTAGIISAQHRDIGAGPYDDFIQIDASVNKGNSGGPTFNLSGEVVGVNTAIFSPSGGNVGIAFAIPASTVETVVASLKDKGSVTRGFIGVQMQPVTKEIAEAIGLKEPKGALVAEAMKDGPAAKAGVKTGDTIIAVDGQPINEAKDLSRKVANVAPGKTVSLTLWRDGKERTVTLEVASQPKGA